MGKGKRNREKHLQGTLSGHAGKVQKANKNPVPSWLPSVIAIVVVVAIMIPLIASAVAGSGIIPRSRILIKSETGKFDMNQQMATFIAWEYLYESGLQYYQYYQYGLIQDSTGMFKYFSSAEDYALTMAQSAVNSTLRDSIDDVADMLKQYVAVCDLAYSEGYRLSEADKEDVEEVIEWLENMQVQLGYTDLNSFLKVVVCEGMKKKDVEKISEMVVLYNRYVSDKQLELDTLITMDDLTKYRDENPGNYYKLDYLTYATENKDDSETLAAAKTQEEFRDAVINIFLKDNYKTTYNKYTTQVTVSDELSQLKNKTDANGDTALSNLLNELKFEESKNYTKTTENLHADLSAYLFDAKRTQFETSSVATDDGIYMVAIMNITKEGTVISSVDARVKFVPFVEGDTHGEDASFKTDLLKIFTENNNGTAAADKTKTDYKTAAEKAADLITKLTAEGADVAKLLTDNGFTKDVLITSETKKSDTLPQAILDKVNDKGTTEANKAFSVIDTKDGNKQYVLFINSVSDDGKTVSYVALESDLFCTIRDDLQTAFDKVYAGEKTLSFAKEPKDGSFEEWICKTTEGYVSARKDGETKVIEVKENEGKEDEKITYNIYMALENDENGPASVIYLDTSWVVKGGYLQFSDKAAAEEALATLEGKVGNDLLTALAAIDSEKMVGTPSTSTSFARSTLENSHKDLAEWFYANERVGNEKAVLTLKDANDKDIYYIAVFTERTNAWNRSARTALLSEQVNDWLTILSTPYEINIKKLDKIGAPSTTVATTTAAAAAA